MEGSRRARPAVLKKRGTPPAPTVHYKFSLRGGAPSAFAFDEGAVPHPVYVCRLLLYIQHQHVPAVNSLQGVNPDKNFEPMLSLSRRSGPAHTIPFRVLLSSLP